MKKVVVNEDGKENGEVDTLKKKWVKKRRWRK
jgi:hypothetical protein